MKHLVTILLFALAAPVFGQSVDFTRLVLTVEFDTINQEVDGMVSLNFTHQGPVDSIFLNGIKMNYREVMLNGKYPEYDFNDKGIWIKPGKAALKDSNTIYISYTARPRKGLYFIGWNTENGKSKRQIWTQGQGIDHRHWIPHRDDQTDKLITDITVIFDADYSVISNGQLQDREMVNETEKLWRYSMEEPMSSYLIALVIGDYDSTQTMSKSGTPLVQYYYPDREDDYDYYYYKNEEIHDFLEDEIGVPFPWQDYKQIPVQDFRHGAMENTTATIFGDFFLVDALAFEDRNYTYVNAHELAHQWFGNLVTAESSSDHWLHEGFATYYQWLSEKNLYGKDHFDWERYKAAELVAESTKKDTVALGNPKAGSNRFYQKGAWVLHMLSNKLGRKDFRKSIQHYLLNYQYGIVTTDSLAKSVEKVSGYDPGEFFDQWVQTPAEPVIRIKQRGLNKDKLYLRVEQDSVMRGFPFEIETKLELVYQQGGTEVKKLLLKKTSEDITIDLKKDTALAYWNFDPGMNILGLVGEDKPQKMAKAQLAYSEGLLDRYEAILYLKTAPHEEKSELLGEVLGNKDEHFAVRAEALKQLLKKGDTEVNKEYMMAALTDPDVQLQKEAIEQVKHIDARMEEVMEELRRGRSYELREKAIHMSVEPQVPENNSWLYNEIYEQQPGIPGNKVRITALLYRVALFKDKEAFASLVEYTSPGQDFLTRINAMQALAPIKLLTEDLAENLFDAFFDPNWKLRKEARLLLEHFYREEEWKKIVDNCIDNHKHNWEDFQKRNVKRTFGANID